MESLDSFLVSVFVSAFFSVDGFESVVDFDSVDDFDEDDDVDVVSVDDDLRLSLMYQPEPLKISPAG